MICLTQLVNNLMLAHAPYSKRIIKIILFGTNVPSKMFERVLASEIIAVLYVSGWLSSAQSEWFKSPANKEG